MPIPSLNLPPANVTPICPYFGICGGCDTQDIVYTDQVQAKGEALQTLFASIASPEKWVSFLASDEEYPIYYRNKIRFSFVEKDGRIWPSRHSRGKDEADIAVDACFLQSKEADELMLFIAEYAQSHGWKLFDTKTETGWLKHILIRQGKHTGETMLSLVTTNSLLPNPEEYIQKVREQFPHIKSLYQSTTDGKNNEKIIDSLLWGEPCIYEKIGEYTFQISPHAFFQTNSDMVETLYSAIKNYVPENSAVWDLYAGSATIGSFVSSKAKNVICIENNSQNNVDALWNIANNAITNVESTSGSVEDVCTSRFINEQGIPDCIIVDPPRAGLSPQARTIIAGIKPFTLIYISCNPLTCFRDCRDLLKKGFTLKLLQGIDMFPHTNHCEMIAVFC